MPTIRSAAALVISTATLLGATATVAVSTAHATAIGQTLQVVPVSPSPNDVCALGRIYGHWPAHSDAARICHSTYGG
ncbi:hypothetical protein [Streptomyces sp. NPDC050738]|uniref:hypothetical protein n=1 Tax=Streptomyces sp. NPDC050738 TaxID=3154744 RepID=UPI00342A81F3